MKSESARKLLIFFAKVGGFTVVSIIAPQFPYKVLKSYMKERGKIDSRKIKRNLDTLQGHGLISISEKDGATKITITKKGKEKTLEYKLDEMKIKKPKKWDGIWRIVMFDIPEEKRVARDVLRSKLKELEFAMIQKSVFVNPYPCKDEIRYIKEIFGVYKYVNLIEARSLDEYNEKFYKKKFGLK